MHQRILVLPLCLCLIGLTFYERTTLHRETFDHAFSHVQNVSLQYASDGFVENPLHTTIQLRNLNTDIDSKKTLEKKSALIVQGHVVDRKQLWNLFETRIQIDHILKGHAKTFITLYEPIKIEDGMICMYGSQIWLKPGLLYQLYLNPVDSQHYNYTHSLFGCFLLKDHLKTYEYKDSQDNLVISKKLLDKYDLIHFINKEDKYLSRYEKGYRLYLEITSSLRK